MKMIYVDRNGRKLELGMKVMVQHCIGRYGQTQQVVGRLARIGELFNVDLEPEAPLPKRNGLPAGMCLYPGFTPAPQLGPNVVRGYQHWKDVEHEHEKFIQILEEAEDDKTAA